MKKIINTALNTLKGGKDAMLVSVIASSGSTPRGAGATMLVFRDERTVGTIGGGAVEYAAEQHAKELLEQKLSDTKGYNLSKNDVANLGMICGGDVTVYFQYLCADNTLSLFEYLSDSFSKNGNTWLIRRIEDNIVTAMGVCDKDGIKFAPEILYNDIKDMLKNSAVLIKNKSVMYYCEPIVKAGMVYIFGGGHVSQKLTPVLASVGFNVTIYEDRERFTDISLFPGAVNTMCGKFTELSQKIEITPYDYVVIMTRGHQADFEVLEQVLRTKAFYIGCIGSRGKIALTKKHLVEVGIPESEFARVHSPIGLDIAAETPEEIAISIAAEMIKHRACTTNFA